MNMEFAWGKEVGVEAGKCIHMYFVYHCNGMEGREEREHTE